MQIARVGGRLGNLLRELRLARLGAVNLVDLVELATLPKPPAQLEQGEAIGVLIDRRPATWPRGSRSLKAAVR